MPDLGNGKICYLETPAADIHRSASFYSTVFGWSVRVRGDGRTAFDDGVGQVSGTWDPTRKPKADPGILIHIMVADIAESVGAIRANGGEIVEGPDPGASNVHAVFRDPPCNVMGIFEEPTFCVVVDQ